MVGKEEEKQKLEQLDKIRQTNETRQNENIKEVKVKVTVICSEGVKGTPYGDLLPKQRRVRSL